MKKRDINRINYILLIVTVILLLISVYLLYRSGFRIVRSPFHIKYKDTSLAYIGYRFLRASLISGFITLITRMYINFLKSSNQDEIQEENLKVDKSI